MGCQLHVNFKYAPPGLVLVCGGFARSLFVEIQVLLYYQSIYSRAPLVYSGTEASPSLVLTPCLTRVPCKPLRSAHREVRVALLALVPYT